VRKALLPALPESFQLAARNLLRHKLRSFLTTLGIVFGVASVISMLSVGAGAQQEILEQIERLGLTNIVVSSVRPPEKKAEGAQRRAVGYGLTFRDLRQVRGTVPGVIEVLPVHIVREKVWAGSRELEEVHVHGVEAAHFRRLNLKAARGRLLTQADGEEGKRVCVVRASGARRLPGFVEPLGRDLRVGAHHWRIVGLLDDREFSTPMGEAIVAQRGAIEIFVPFASALQAYGISHVVRKAGSFELTRVELDQMLVSVRDRDAVLPVARVIRSVLEKFHDQADYEITVPLELLQQSEATQRVFNVVMLLIAGISLVVGGIGIVNIMLATITERTREIGIRRAVGARRRDITVQFLVETVTIALAGGVLGIAVGLGGVWAIVAYTGWKSVVTPASVGLSLVISCGVGVLFGLYPARRAAALDPIVALRHE